MTVAGGTVADYLERPRTPEPTVGTLQERPGNRWVIWDGERYLDSDGSAVRRDEFPALFEAIGTVFGAGDGETTFNLPDLTDYDLERKIKLESGDDL